MNNIKLVKLFSKVTNGVIVEREMVISVNGTREGSLSVILDLIKDGWDIVR